MEVQLLFRKRNPIHFSIEGIFNNLFSEFSTKEDVDVSKLEMPNYSTSQLSLFKNILFARKNQKSINHITGDVHYVSLGMSGRNTVLTIHDCVTLTKQRNAIKQWLIKKLWYEWPVRKASIITVISEKTKIELIEHTGCDPEKIHVVSNFYDPIFVEKEKEFNSEKPRILQIGTRENKNIERVIEALGKIECTYVIVGEVTPKQIELLKSHEVDFEVHNKISKDKLLQQYFDCDLVCFVSTYEGFGMPIIEAQAVGRPVVTSKIEPMTSVASTAALFVDPYSVDSIRNGILEVISNNDLRNRLINEGMINVNRFSIESISNQYLAIYNEALS